MRVNRWVCGAGSVTMALAGGVVGGQSACSTTPSIIFGPYDAGAAGTGNSSGTGTGTGTAVGEGGPPDAGTYTYPPGDGGACLGPVGGYPPVTCDPSDEKAMGCSMAASAISACGLSAACGDPTTCEPFTANPDPDKGVDNFRMRLINITAPHSLTTTIIEGTVVGAGVSLPAFDGGNCGENGSGLFNWLLQVDKTAGTVKTGGAPASADPITVGYCFVDGTVNSNKIAPLTFKATFTGNTFSTAPDPTTLDVPIFIEGGGVVILPIHDGSFNQVDISNDGQCIGQINNGSISPNGQGLCVPGSVSGANSCSHWHSGGVLGGYILLSEADQIPIVTLGGSSLCTLLTGATNGKSPANCPTSALTQGDYNPPTTDGGTGSAAPGNNGTAMWLSAQFAASAVKITQGTGIAICNGGSVGDGGS